MTDTAIGFLIAEDLIEIKPQPEVMWLRLRVPDYLAPDVTAAIDAHSRLRKALEL